MSASASNYASLSEDELISHVVNRSEKGLEELCRRFGPLLRTIIQRTLNCDADSDDILQDVFLQVWHKCDKYCRRKGNLAGWLVTMARRRAIDFLRRRSARQRLTNRFGQEMEASGMGRPTCVVDEEVRRHDLQSILDTLIRLELPEEQREVVRLTYFQGLSQSQIAACLALPLGTVKTRVALGIRKLSHSALLKQAA